MKKLALFLLIALAFCSEAYAGQNGSHRVLFMQHTQTGKIPTCQQWTNFQPRLTTPTTQESNAIQTFICDMVIYNLITGPLTGTSSCSSIGNPSPFDAIWIIANSSSNYALNICGTANSLVNHGATFTAGSGFISPGGAIYVDTTFDPTLSTTNWSQDNAGAWIWTLTNFTAGTDYGSALANSSGTQNIRLYPHFSDNSLYPAINQATETSINVTGHFYGASRTGPSTLLNFVDTSGFSTSVSSVTPVGPTIILMADKTDGTNPFQGNVAFAAVGANLSTLQEGLFYAATHKLMQQIAGAP